MGGTWGVTFDEMCAALDVYLFAFDSEEDKTFEGDSSEISCVCVQDHPGVWYHELRQVLEVAVPICGC